MSNADAGQTTLTPLRAWMGLIVLSLCYVFSLLDRLVLSLLVEPLKMSLSLSDLQVGLLQGPAFVVLYATLGVPLGRLADLLSRRNLIAWAIAFWGVCTAAGSMASGFASLAMARVGVGAGEAALTPAAYSLIGDSFGKERLGQAMGVYTAGGAIGSGIALLVGGRIYRAFESVRPLRLPVVGAVQPWQATLLSVGLPGIVLAVLVCVVVREPGRAGAPEKPAFGRVVRMLWDRRGFYVPAFVSYAAVTGLAYAFVSWAPAFLARRYSLGPAEVGAHFGPVMLLAGLLGPLVAGSLADRLRARHGSLSPFRVMNVLFVVVVAASYLAFSAKEFDIALAGCGLVGFLATGLLGLPPLALLLATAPEIRGQVAGINLMTGNLLGLTIGPLGVAVLSQYVLAAGSLGQALGCVVAALAVAGLLASLFTRPLDPEPCTSG